ncbi:MAG TPA: GIY-YIG nuclease family protein [Candidatus Acidoferrum sp.]|nr:GIY-YIG nuclease family protein [Candidatus Acidoferrum sp.]
MPYWVYIVQSGSTGRYYVGQTNALDQRLRRHNEGRTEANRGRGPWRLVYQEECPTRQAAVVRERAIKARKSRAYIQTLCSRAREG